MALDLKKIKGISKNPWSFTLSDENNPFQILGYVDTGCYILNAMICDGDIYGGLPLGKRLMLSGEPSTAKSFFADFIIKAYLDKYKKGVVVLFETEGSSIAQTAKEIGIDLDRVIIEPVREVETLHKMILNYCEKVKDDYLTTKKHTRILYVIDSLGMLSSKKELDDKKDGKDTVDMTIAKAKKAMFRAISLELSLLQTPMIVANHVYDNQSKYGDKQIISGGSGAKFASDVSLILNKSQRRIGAIQTGVTIKAKVKKSRWIKENLRCEIGLDFAKGMVKCSYLPQLAGLLGMLQIKDEKTVIYKGESYDLGRFENDFEELFDQEDMKKLATKIKDNFTFGESELDIEFLSVDQLAVYGVQYGFISEKPRSFILPDGQKIKKNELRADNSLMPVDIIEKIKAKLREENA